jgi:cytochrome c554/c'-like protein
MLTLMPFGSGCNEICGRNASLLLCLVVWAGALGTAAGPPPLRASDAQASVQGFVGAAKCAECHNDVYQRWTGARHGKMLQPASAASVLGDFSTTPITLRGTRFTLEHASNRFTIRGVFPSAREETHQVGYTLGSRRVQHYLTTLADGRIVVLPPTWDVERREWFHNLDIVNPDTPEGAARNPIQVWNSQCVGCHVSAEDKGYDAAADTYTTRWTDFGTNCERCHGPGSAHVARYASPTAPAGATGSTIVVPTQLSAGRSTMICAQCHSLRDLTVPGFVAGGDYFDHFTPVLEYGQKAGRDPAYWADGRPRRFSNDAIGFWQSRCFLDGGATCTSCHADPHEPDIDRHPELARRNDTLCTTCHQTIAQDIARHTRHAAGSAGSACIACHMPRTVISLRSRMPDHTLSVPAPENTVRYGIPNACTECHSDKGGAWAVAKLADWYPKGRRERLVARAAAFTDGRRRDPAGVASLVAIARDVSQPPVVRANAVGYLRYFPVRLAEAALAASAASEHAVIRLTAVLGFGEPGFSRSVAIPVLTHALADARRVVRVGAAVSLANLNATDLQGDDARRFDAAKQDYVTRGTLLADDPTALLDVGKFQLLSRDADAAARTLEASLRLDGTLQGSRYFLALARLAQGRVADARDLLLRIPKDDAYAAIAAKLLATLPPRAPGRVHLGLVLKTARE